MTQFQITVFSELYGETECCIQDINHALKGGYNPCADGTEYRLTFHEISQLNNGVDYLDVIPSSKLKYPYNLISMMEIKGNCLIIPQSFIFNKKQYSDLKTVLKKAGGGYLKNSFKFDEPAEAVYLRIINGEDFNLKKKFQFFGTPSDLADYLVELSEVNNEHEVLEPSAGRGAIIEAIHREIYPSYTVWAYELLDINRSFLDKIIGCRLLGNDFLSECDTHFDRIIANPPFNKNQDIDHIKKMYDSLKDNGRLVSIASKHWQTSNNKKECEFREWLKEKNANIIEIPKGRFKESGTMVATCIIVLDKVNC